MRLRSLLGALGIAAAFVSGCAVGGTESGAGPAEEPTEQERSAFDASMFEFGVHVPDDHQGIAGGSQRAVAKLHFVDARASWINPDIWDCRVMIEMPIRHHSLGIITPAHAADMSVAAAEAASSFVMRSQPRWIAALFCPR